MDRIFKEVEAMVFDVDGVFTDSGLLVTEEGQLLRRMNTRDGLAVKIALASGMRIGVITGGTSEGVRLRLKALGVKELYLGVSEKKTVLEKILRNWNVRPENTLYMGDDIPDISCLNYVGIPVCPADAVEEVKEVSKYVSIHKGGAGCVREVIERVVKSMGLWRW